MEVLIVPAIFFGIIGVSIYLNHRYEKKRAEAMEALAKSLGFTLQKDADLSSIHGFPLFTQGHSSRAFNMMRGVADNIDVRIFDYRYTTGSGKNKHTTIQTVMSFTTPALSLPDFVLRPENIFHKIGGVFGYQDIDFTSHPGFSKQYLLRSDDEEAVRTVFKPALLTAYERQTTPLSTEGGRDSLIFYHAGKRLDAAGIRLLLGNAFSLFSLFKRDA